VEMTGMEGLAQRVSAIALAMSQLHRDHVNQPVRWRPCIRNCASGSKMCSDMLAAGETEQRSWADFPDLEPRHSCCLICRRRRSSVSVLPDEVLFDGKLAPAWFVVQEQGHCGGGA